VVRGGRHEKTSKKPFGVGPREGTASKVNRLKMGLGGGELLDKIKKGKYKQT